MKPIYIYGANPDGEGAANACEYYRVTTPFHSLYDLYGAKIYRPRRNDTVENMVTAALSADIAHYYSIIGEAVLHQQAVIKKTKAGIQGDNTIKIPPAFVWDCDDNTDFVHPINTAFAEHGIRSYPDLKLLEPGDSLYITDDNDEKIVAWEDKETVNNDGITFDIERNLEYMRIRHQIVREAHGVTCSNPILANYLKEVIGQPNVYFYPNTVVPSDYTDFDLAPKDEIRILWQGAMAHWVDWYPLREAVRIVAQKYPKVKWIMYGEKFSSLTDMIPQSQLEIIGWTPYSAYKLRRGLIQADINICPLADNIFNRCKSAIKWYEGSVWKKPEATLAANVGAYALEMQDNVTGLLYSTPEEFVEKLSALIESAELRNRLGHAAKEWILSNRTPEHTTPGLYDFYHELRARRAHDVFKYGSKLLRDKALEAGWLGE